jgi:hypothetical protein
MGQLSTGAVPAVIDFFHLDADNDVVHTWAGQWLAKQHHKLERQQSYSQTIFARHNARGAAWSQLQAISDQLPAYDPYFFRSYSDSFYDIYVTPETGR